MQMLIKTGSLKNFGRPWCLPYLHVVHSFSIMKLLDVGIVWQPGLVPVIDSVKVAGVIETSIPGWNGAEVASFKHVQS